MDMARFIRGLRPKAVMLENVPGLARDSRYSSFVQEIRNWGYDVTWKIVDAANFGVPQRRQRLVMLASRVGTVVFPETRPKLLTVRDVIGGLPLPGESNDPLHDIGENRSDAVKQVIGLIPKDGGSRKDIADKWQLACHKRMKGFHDVYGRLAWDAVAPTITSGCLNPSKGRFLHPEQDRAITPREAALLQGFPADYWFSPRRGKEHLAVQIGNAFPPEMIRQIARPSAFGL